MSENDRDLLEKAAKAAGYVTRWNPEWSGGYGCFQRQVLPSQDPVLSDWVRWNPLDDDGDALRLAVTLSIDIEHQCPGVEAYRSHNHESYDGGGTFCASEDGSDPYAATRRAIVRAAAVLGATHE